MNEIPRPIVIIGSLDNIDIIQAIEKLVEDGVPRELIQVIEKDATDSIQQDSCQFINNILTELDDISIKFRRQFEFLKNQEIYEKRNYKIAQKKIKKHNKGFNNQVNGKQRIQFKKG